MTGVGFEGGAYSMPWITAWLGLFIIALIIMLSKKWFEEEQILGMPYSFIGGFAGPIAYFIVIALVGEAKWAFLAGLIGLAGGGLGLGRWLDGS